MAIEQLHRFLDALRRYESNNTYQHVSSDKRVGAYGISPDNWRRWTEQVGLSGAPWQSKAAQDMVAREKATEFYQRYGDWQLVALAWWGGTEYADDVAANGIVSQAEMGAEAIELTKGIRPSQRARPQAATPQQPPADASAQAGPETQLTRALKQAGHIPRTELSVKDSEMHRMMAPILQGLSNSIRNSATRADGLPADAGAAVDQGASS